MQLLTVIIIIAIVSVCLALISLSRQRKIGEVKKANKELKKNRVIFYSDSSSSS